MHVLSHTYSKCSMKVRNLRELPGNPPIGTFLPVYDLLHTHGCTAQKKPKLKYIQITLSHNRGAKVTAGLSKRSKKKNNARDSTLTASAFCLTFEPQKAHEAHTHILAH